MGPLGASGASAFTGAGGGMGAAFALGADAAASPFVGSLTAPTGFYYSPPAPGVNSMAAYDQYAHAVGDSSAAAQLLADAYNVSTSAAEREREAHSLATASA